MLPKSLRLVAFAASAPFFGVLAGELPAQSSGPNIVYILADDMGLGDVRSYTSAAGQAGVDSPVDTPNIDRLAATGMRFTNAHSPSAVCTAPDLSDCGCPELFYLAPNE